MFSLERANIRYRRFYIAWWLFMSQVNIYCIFHSDDRSKWLPQQIGYHGDDNAAMARLRHPRCVPRHFPRYRHLSLDEWRTSADHPGVHHGQPQTGHPADSNIYVCIFPVGNPIARSAGRDVPVWRPVSPVGSSWIHMCNTNRWAFDCTVALSAETCQY